MKDEIKKLYESGLSIRKIEEFCNVKRSRINSILNELGVKMKTKGNSYKIRKYSLNETYFNKIDNEEKAYWLGFIIADGHISDDGLIITLAEKDINQLKKILLVLESDSPIKFNKKTKSVTVSLYSKLMVIDFRNLGLLKDKTNNVMFPIIEDSLQKHLIRGIIDGDGSIAISKRKNLLNKKEFSLTICGTKDIIEKSSMVICNDLKIIQRKLYMRNDNFGTVEWSGNKMCLEILEYLYSDSKIFLDRKYDRYIELKKQQSW